MEKENVPQDQDQNLGIKLNLLKYATDSDGSYTRVKSSGWEAENTVLSLAWDEISQRVEAVKERVKKGEISPLAFYLEKNQMDVKILSDYTGFWRFTIYLHLRPFFFDRLAESKLEKYARVFQISISDLKQIPEL